MPKQSDIEASLGKASSSSTRDQFAAKWALFSQRFSDSRQSTLPPVEMCEKHSDNAMQRMENFLEAWAATLSGDHNLCHWLREYGSKDDAETRDQLQKECRDLLEYIQNPRNYYTSNNKSLDAEILPKRLKELEKARKIEKSIETLLSKIQKDYASRPSKKPSIIPGTNSLQRDFAKQSLLDHLR